MFSVFSFGDTPSSQGRRGPSWSSLETMLLIECYAIYLPTLESSGSDFETGEAYCNIVDIKMVFKNNQSKNDLLLRVE